MSALELMSAFVQVDSFSTESIKHHKHCIVKDTLKKQDSVIARTQCLNR